VNTDANTTNTPSGSGGRAWTEERIRALGAVTDLPTAGRIFGLGRALSYELAKTGRFPAPILHVGSRYRVPVAGILATLGLAPSTDLTSGATRSVDHHGAISSIDAPPTDDEGTR
jgi:hypothetical protein